MVGISENMELYIGSRTVPQIWASNKDEKMNRRKLWGK